MHNNGRQKSPSLSHGRGMSAVAFSARYWAGTTQRWTWTARPAAGAAGSAPSGAFVPRSGSVGRLGFADPGLAGNIIVRSCRNGFAFLLELRPVTQRNRVQDAPRHLYRFIVARAATAFHAQAAQPGAGRQMKADGSTVWPLTMTSK